MESAHAISYTKKLVIDKSSNTILGTDEDKDVEFE